MSNPLKKLAGQTVIYGFSTIFPRLLNYLLVPFLTYKFTNPADFGVNTEIYAYISFLNIVLAYGMQTAYFNFVNKEGNKDSVFGTALLSLLGTSLLFCIAGFICSTTIAKLLGHENEVRFIQWMILIIVSDALMIIPFARLRNENKPWRFALLKISNIVVNLGTVIFFLQICRNDFLSENGITTVSSWSHFYDPKIGIGYVFLANVIANFSTLVLLIPQFFKIKLQFDFLLWKRMMIYALPLLVVGLAGMVNETFDRIILKELLPGERGLHDLGVYGACYKIAMLMTIFIQAFGFAAEPFYFGHSNDKNSGKLNAIVMKYFVIACAFIFLVTILNLRWIQYIIGKSYWEGLPVVPILLLANICLGIHYNLSIWYKLTGKTRAGAMVTLLGAVITVIINFLFVPAYSYMASAWATLLSYAAMMVLSYLLLQKYYPIRYNLKSIFFFTGSALVLFFVSLCWKDKFPFLLELILNNSLLLVFCALFYKFEWPNLKKSNAAN